jgi:very-short-patch-repair endonuclease
MVDENEIIQIQNINKIPYGKSFAVHEKSKNWSNKNENSPENYTIKSGQKVWFDCECGHTFKGTLYNIAEGCWCPFCASKKICDKEDCTMCQNKSFASNFKSKYWSEKNVGSPRNYLKFSKVEFYFECENKHLFQISLVDIMSGTWCPCCSSRKLCDNINCESCYNTSFASDPKATYWSIQNKTHPRDHIRTSHDLCIFECEICKHTFSTKLSDIARGCWCQYCGLKKLCYDDTCTICYERSFASHTKSKYWSTQNTLRPREIFKSSNKKFNFDCDICGHIFYTTLSWVTRNGGWCNYCSHNLLCDNEECIICYDNSFLSHQMSKYWSKKNIESPRKVFKYCNNKFYFDCPHCSEEYCSRLNDIVSGKWCSCVYLKSELKLFKYLKTTYNTLKIEKQIRFNWCKKNKCLPFDFCIEEYKIIIELDGVQHFKQVSNWGSPISTQEKDNYKMLCAKQNGYSIIRILQEDVFYDKNDWQNKINKIILDLIQLPIRKYVFIGDIYINFDAYLSIEGVYI